MSQSEKSYVIYDGECPFCSAYVEFMRLREALGSVELVNAREPHPVVDLVRQRGFVIDHGMALVQGENIYHGADCIHRLSLMTTPSSWFNRLNAVVFRSPNLSRLLYPMLRGGRSAALRVLGRKRLGY